MTLQEALAQHGTILSFAEGRRAVCLNAVKLNGVQATAEDLTKEVKDGDVIQFGKRTFTINCTKE